MLLARWPRPKHSNDRAMTENALRCCLLISSAFCGLVGCDCAGRVALSSSSPWQRSRRILRYAKLIGRENVMAGADCGFSSQALYKTEVHPTVVWEKFKAMRAGADIATKKLW